MERLFFSNTKARAEDEDYGRVDDVLSSIKAYAQICNSSCFVVDFIRHELVFRTDRLLYIDESSVLDVQHYCPVPYWSLIPKKELQRVIDAYDNYLKFASALPPAECRDHIYVLNFHIVLKNRKFMITQKFVPLLLDAQGGIWMGLFSVTPSSLIGSGHSAIFYGNKRWDYDNDKQVFLMYEPLSLTFMEKAVLLRASKGMSNQQIADDLCRSVNTVKSHKQKIFSKLGVKSISEAIAYANNNHLM
ncbi:MAG: helix-turn-helix transcriptional regulator [Bacteroidales bacterium]|nr:helix-turn-helix transcriptional regulator [Bacteroidales bacterium]